MFYSIIIGYLQVVLMSLAKKTSHFILIALVAGCGGHVPVAQPRALVDDSYTLSFTRVNLVESEPGYHFQLCRRQSGAKMATEATDTEAAAGEQACFNPFENVEGEPLVFTALPTAASLQVKGVAGTALRYTAGTAAVLVFGALAFVLIPRAARLAFTKLLQLHKTSRAGETDEVIEHLARKITEKAQRKALRKGESFNYTQHYKQVLEDRQAAFSIFKTKPALFFGSLFIVGSTIGGWKFSYEAWRDTSKQLVERGWGRKELELAEAYPFLASGDLYRVTSVKQLLETLHQHQQLIFSAAYLRTFPPPPDATDGNAINKIF